MTYHPEVSSQLRSRIPERGVTRPKCFRNDSYCVYGVDAFDWLARAEKNSIHAVVTDPPYGLVEYTPVQLEKRKNGNGGVWGIPPSFDGCVRSPLPRFTVLTDTEKKALRAFSKGLAEGLMPALTPGAHVFIATNPLVSDLVYQPFIDTGFEKRGEIIRLVYTLRGGDRPKGARRPMKRSKISFLPLWREVWSDR